MRAMFGPQAESSREQIEITYQLIKSKDQTTHIEWSKKDGHLKKRHILSLQTRTTTYYVPFCPIRSRKRSKYGLGGVTH